jgi:hypothetical protein
MYILVNIFFLQILNSCKIVKNFSSIYIYLLFFIFFKKKIIFNFFFINPQQL